MKKSAAMAAPERKVTRSGPRRISASRPRSGDLEPRREAGMAQGREGEGRHDRGGRGRLGPVLRDHGRKLDRLATQVRARGEELLAEKGVVARADEEGQLGHLV